MPTNHDTSLVTDIAAHQYTFRADPSVPSPGHANHSHGEREAKRDPDSGDGDGTDGKKGKGVNRVGRACNGCRKQKMRCEGADDPPCKRCRHAKIPCLFEKPMRDQGGPGEQGMERIRNLEQQVTSIQSTLTELVQTFKQSVSALPALAQPPPRTPPPRSAHPDNASVGHYGSLPPPQTPTNTNGVGYGGSGGRGGSGRSASVSSSATGVSVGTGGGPPVYAPPAHPPPDRLQFPPPSQPTEHAPPPYPPPAVPPPATSTAIHTHQYASHHGGNIYLPPVTIPYPNHSHPGPPSASGSAGTNERLPSLSAHLESITAELNGGRRSAMASVSPTSARRTAAVSATPTIASLTSSGSTSAPPSRPSVTFSPDLPPSSFNYHPAAPLTTGLGGGVSGGLIPSSNVTSAYSSEDEGELPNHGLTAPLEVLRSMADAQEGEGEGGVEGVERERAVGVGVVSSGKEKEKERSRERSREMTFDSRSPPPPHVHTGPGPTPGAGPSAPPTASSEAGTTSGYASGGGGSAGGAGGGEDGRPNKRRRIDKKGVARERQPHHFPDVVTKALVSESEAKALFKIFYDGCSKFLPVFEPLQDTFDVLHTRSPFCVDAICTVASQVRDGGDVPSDTTKILLKEVREMSAQTLWTYVARREAVQATILMAGWSTNGWLAGGHAVRMALELGMHKAWPRLSRRIKAGKTKNIIGSDDHDLVVCSRIWFCLYLFEHQISFGTGRPAILKEDESVKECRLFLTHPLSVEDDMRLVSTVELMIIRERLHNKLMPFDTPVGLRTFEIIREGERHFSEWFQEWDTRFAMGYPDYTFYRHSLLVQRFLSELFHNAVGLRGIRGPEDVARMPFEQHQLAVQSIKVGQSAMDICIRSITYRDGFKYAPDYTHVTATFAASFLIRLARLFPSEANLSAICNDVEELANLLSQVPATRYANTLRTMLRVAQQRKVLPIRQLALSSNAEGGAYPPNGYVDAAAGTGNNSNAYEPKQQSYSPQDLPVPAGLPMLYPDSSFIEPALGGEPPLASMIIPVPHQPQEGMWPPDTSFSAFVPNGFGYQAMLAPADVDYGEIW